MEEYKNYFMHTIGARNSARLTRLQMDMGALGYAIYWFLIEMLHEFDGYLPMDFNMLAYQIRWAKAEDIKKVIFDFELFKNDGNRFWSQSALRRIEHRKKISTCRSLAGSKGAAVTNGRRKTNKNSSCNEIILDSEAAIVDSRLITSTAIAGDNADIQQTNDDEFVNKCTGKADTISGKNGANDEISPGKMTTNIYNKENQPSKESISLPPDSTNKNRLFEIFFFKNFINPQKEVERFLSYYEARDWVFGTGQKVKSIEAAAKCWKPENNELRFDSEFVSWYQIVYACAGENKAMQYRLMVDIEHVSRRNQELTIRYKNKESAQFAANLVEENKLKKTWILIWKVSN